MLGQVGSFICTRWKQ
jgi:hypothetical protein